jgi:hypothetical protein
MDVRTLTSFTDVDNTLHKAIVRELVRSLSSWITNKISTSTFRHSHLLLFIVIIIIIFLLILLLLLQWIDTCNVLQYVLEFKGKNTQQHGIKKNVTNNNEKFIKNLFLSVFSFLFLYSTVQICIRFTELAKFRLKNNFISYSNNNKKYNIRIIHSSTTIKSENCISNSRLHHQKRKKCVYTAKWLYFLLILNGFHKEVDQVVIAFWMTGWLTWFRNLV